MKESPVTFPLYFLDRVGGETYIWSGRQLRASTLTMDGSL
jgi:hypothetical protein